MAIELEDKIVNLYDLMVAFNDFSMSESDWDAYKETWPKRVLTVNNPTVTYQYGTSEIGILNYTFEETFDTEEAFEYALYDTLELKPDGFYTIKCYSGTTLVKEVAVDRLAPNSYIPIGYTMSSNSTFTWGPPNCAHLRMDGCSEGTAMVNFWINAQGTDLSTLNITKVEVWDRDPNNIPVPPIDPYTLILNESVSPSYSSYDGTTNIFIKLLEWDTSFASEKAFEDEIAEDPGFIKSAGYKVVLYDNNEEIIKSLVFNDLVEDSSRTSYSWCSLSQYGTSSWEEENDAKFIVEGCYNWFEEDKPYLTFRVEMTGDFTHEGIASAKVYRIETN